ncbi:hypothetical protein [Rhodocaloribacter sp.]
MFDVSEKDYAPLEDYRYGWRWTDPNRLSLAPDDLRRIRPLTPEKAREAWTYSEAFQGKAYQTRFREIDAFHVDARNEAVRAWLHATLPPEPERLFLSWTEDMAVETDRDTLVRHWDTFCYPVEDVVIWPHSERWVLLFDYKQRFYFAVASPPEAGP